MSARKRSTKPSKKTARTTSKKPAGKVARKTAKKSSKKVASKPAAKGSKKVAKKTTKKRAKKAARKATKKTAKKVARKPAGKVRGTSQQPRTKTDLSPADRHAMIAKAAYYRAERRDFADGDPVKDWLASEREIDAVLHPPG